MRKYYKKISRPIVSFVILGIAAVVLFFSAFSLWNSELFQYIFTPRVLLQTNAEDLANNAYYSAYNNFFLDYYGYDDYGRYYVVPVADTTESGEYAGYTYMGFYVYEEDVALADRIVELTWEDYDSGNDDIWISGRGYVVKMDSTEKMYFKDWFVQNGADDELVDKLCYKTFYLTPVELMVVIDGGKFFVSALLVLASLIVIIFSLYKLLSGYKKQVKKYIKKNELDPERLAYELDGGVQFQTAVVTDRIAMGFKPKGFLVKLGDLVWVYDSVMRKTSNNSYYGGMKSSTFFIYRIVLVDRSRHKMIVELPGREEGERMMETLKAKAPYLIYGFSEELARTMKQDFSRLIRQVDEKKAGDGFYGGLW